MKSVLNGLSLYFETVPDRLRMRKWLVWLFFILVTAVAIYGAFQTKFDMTLEGWFSEEDPVKVALEDFKAEFGSDDGVFIVYRPKDGNVFSTKSLRLIREMREELLNYHMRLKDGESSYLDHVVRINTLTNAPVLEVKEDALISRRLVQANIPTSQKELQEIRNLALKQKTFPLLYFSKDYQYGGIFIETDFGTIPVDSLEAAASEDQVLEDELILDDEVMEISDETMVEKVKYKSTEMDDYLGLMKEIKVVLNKPEYANHFVYYPVGNAPLMEYGLEVMSEMGPMYLGMLVIMIVLLWYLFRSLSAVVWPISIVVLSSVWTVGFTSLLGFTITTMLMLTIMLILAVGTADAIHILSGYLFFRGRDFDHQAALRQAFKKSALACLLTTITTMLGMLALTFTEIAHIKVFGYMSAIGVCLAFVFTIFLLPLMMDLWSPVPKKSGRKMGKIMEKVTRFIPDFSKTLQNWLDGILPLVQKSPTGFTLLFLAIFGICVFGATQVVVDSNVIEQFKEGSSIRNTYEIVDEKMMGSQSMEIYMDIGAEYAFQDPELLKVMDQLQQTIESKYGNLVIRTSSLVDVVKDSYQTLNENRVEMYKIPDDPGVLAQTLFLFNNANPDDRRKLVSDDYSKSHISVQLHNTGSFEYLEMFSKMKSDIDQATAQFKTRYPDTEVSITGGLALIMKLSDYIAWSQVKSLGLVIVVISVILIFVFGSFRAGFISIIPNLIPATITFGLLGLLGIPLDSDTMIIAPVIIGVAVDDTIHFITHYRGEVIIDGDIVRALRETIQEVGQAITFTTLILGLGFSIMSFSSHVGTSIMGQFGTLAIFVALLCDLFMLPAMILIFKPRFQKMSAEQVQAASSIE